MWYFLRLKWKERGCTMMSDLGWFYPDPDPTIGKKPDTTVVKKQHPDPTFNKKNRILIQPLKKTESGSELWRKKIGPRSYLIFTIFFFLLLFYLFMHKIIIIIINFIWNKPIYVQTGSGSALWNMGLKIAHRLED